MGWGLLESTMSFVFVGLSLSPVKINPVNNDVDIIGTQAGKLVEEGGRQLLLYKRERDRKVSCTEHA